MIIIDKNVHHLIHAKEPDMIQKYLELIGKVDSKTLKKINKYRVLAGNSEI